MIAFNILTILIDFLEDSTTTKMTSITRVRRASATSKGSDQKAGYLLAIVIPALLIGMSWIPKMIKK